MDRKCGECKFEVNGQCRKIPPVINLYWRPGHKIHESATEYPYVGKDGPECGEFADEVRIIKYCVCQHPKSAHDESGCNVCTSMLDAAPVFCDCKEYRSKDEAS